MGACIWKRVVFDMSCKRFQFFVNVEALHVHTVIILSFKTDSSGQTVQTQFRLLLEEEQSDQGLHCLLFHLHFLDEMSTWSKGFASLFKF